MDMKFDGVIVVLGSPNNAQGQLLSGHRLVPPLYGLKVNPYDQTTCP